MQKGGDLGAVVRRLIAGKVLVLIKYHHAIHIVLLSTVADKTSLFVASTTAFQLHFCNLLLRLQKFNHLQIS